MGSLNYWLVVRDRERMETNRRGFARCYINGHSVADKALDVEVRTEDGWSSSAGDPAEQSQDISRVRARVTITGPASLWVESEVARAARELSNITIAWEDSGSSSYYVGATLTSDRLGDGDNIVLDFDCFPLG
jgi:hypothetical protein